MVWYGIQGSKNRITVCKSIKPGLKKSSATKISRQVVTLILMATNSANEFESHEWLFIAAMQGQQGWKSPIFWANIAALTSYNFSRYEISRAATALMS
jgi:hypothetical protein